jgi:hypothetical protein
MREGYAPPGNPGDRLLRLRGMRIPTTVFAGCLALAVLAGACRDDTDVNAGDDPSGDDASGGDASGGDADPAAPDIVGTITSVEAFVPVTEDCTPPDDVDPDGAVSSDGPPSCTPDDSDVLGTVLVEERPEAPDEGRKISFTATSEAQFQGEAPDGTIVVAFDDLAAGQEVRAWASGGGCAESYPEQCGLEVIHVTG